MRCPYCSDSETRVTDSREGERTVRRRRECLACGRRFTTYERVESISTWVVKKDGRREAFDGQKLIEGIRKACAKRPVATEVIEGLVNEVESELLKLGPVEVPSKSIGEMVIQRLREIDDVAYVRFASVYRQFADVDNLIEEIEDYKEWKKNTSVLKHQMSLLTLD
ncbi:MAG: transcriptional regulator NrdR [Chloroflexi bacterium]|nr:transcriptional regulator NrdR [Chloroflexota bacterium]MDA8188678.1 transcriptional regulator NrdR [Dehalococcoidales bacterium]